ncbi:MAG: lytic transglycosylase domain-containing protein [Candidatus Micrarchaeota archaeon]|nr:lytic transglycosylase domain-containing protein [Candidatus Micrarchaeota archaeon]
MKPRAAAAFAFAIAALLFIVPAAQAVSICMPTCTDALKQRMGILEEKEKPAIDFGATSDQLFSGCGISKIDESFSTPIGSGGTTTFDALIRKAVVENGGTVSPELVKQIMIVESNGNPNAVSSTGARGLMQLTKDSEAYNRGNSKFTKWDSVRDFSDPASIWCPQNNILAGIMQINACKSQGFKTDNDIVCCYYVGATNCRKGANPAVGPSILEHLRKLSKARATVEGYA